MILYNDFRLHNKYHYKIVTYIYYVFLQFVFTPYDEVMAILPDYCKAGEEIWTAEVPLIFYYVVEYHFPDRFCRQFHGFQDVPHPVHFRKDLHDLDGRSGRYISNWLDKHREYVQAYVDAPNSVVQMQVPQGQHSVSYAYLRWYHQCGRRIIGNPAHSVREGYQSLSAAYTEVVSMCCF